MIFTTLFNALHEALYVILSSHINILLSFSSTYVNVLFVVALPETTITLKIELLLKAGKTVDDIYCNPSVLKKYNLSGLDSAIKLLEQNGLDPKKVPLMAY